MRMHREESSRCLLALFPPQLFSLSTVAGHSSHHFLHPEERALISRATQKRRGDFAAGRHCARTALARLGKPDAPLLQQACGAPLWPAGTVGSISHTSGCVIGVTAIDTQIRAVGVDVEKLGPEFPPGVLELACSEGERAWLRGLSREESLIGIYALFSAKESVIKCVSGAFNHTLSLTDIGIDLDLQSGVFRALVTSQGCPVVPPLSGRVKSNGQHVFAGIWWLQHGLGSRQQERNQ